MNLNITENILYRFLPSEGRTHRQMEDIEAKREEEKMNKAINSRSKICVPESKNSGKDLKQQRERDTKGKTQNSRKE